MVWYVTVACCSSGRTAQRLAMQEHSAPVHGKAKGTRLGVYKNKGGVYPDKLMEMEL